MCYNGLVHTLILFSFVQLTIRFHVLHCFLFSQLFYLCRLSVCLWRLSVLNYRLCPADHLCSVTRSFAWLHMCTFTTIASNHVFNLSLVPVWVCFVHTDIHKLLICHTDLILKSSLYDSVHIANDERQADLCFRLQSHLRLIRMHTWTCI